MGENLKSQIQNPLYLPLEFHKTVFFIPFFVKVLTKFAKIFMIIKISANMEEE